MTAPLTIALTGGIGAGKSTVAQMMRDFGAYVIDWDAVAREVQQPGTDAWKQIRKRWPNVFGADQHIDRAALGEIVFNNPHERRALEAITHPAIRRAAFQRAEQACWRAGSLGEHMIVHEIPLLVESGLADRFDTVITVEAPAPIRVARLQAARNMTGEQAAARIAAQASDAQRCAIAAAVLDSSGTLSQLRCDVRQLLTELAATTNRAAAP